MLQRRVLERYPEFWTSLGSNGEHTEKYWTFWTQKSPIGRQPKPCRQPSPLRTLSDLALRSEDEFHRRRTLESVTTTTVSEDPQLILNPLFKAAQNIADLLARVKIRRHIDVLAALPVANLQKIIVGKFIPMVVLTSM